MKCLQVGKKVSIAFELQCSGDEAFGSVIMLGKMKSGNVVFKKGDVIVMWDTENDRTPALFDASTGSFSGQRVQ